VRHQISSSRVTLFNERAKDGLQDGPGGYTASMKTPTTPRGRVLIAGAAAGLFAAAGCASVTAIERPLPTFETPALDGSALTDAMLRGKVALVNFWGPS
jgi:hypothetical protein